MNVEMPDGTIIEDVPEGTTKAQVLAKYHAHVTGAKPAATADNTPTDAKALGGAAEALMAMGSGMVAKPLSDVAGLGAIPLHAMGAISTDPSAVKESVQRGMTYAPRTEWGKNATEYNPLALIAKGVDWLGNRFEAGPNDGPLRTAVGQGLHEATNQAPALLGLKGGSVADMLAASSKNQARNYMQKALRPTLEDQQSGVAQKAGDYLLDKGINVTQGGVEKMTATRDALDAQLKDIIQNSTKSINRDNVAWRAQPVLDQARMQADPVADVAAVNKTWDNFLANHPEKMPVQYAQAVKQGTYRSLGDKAYAGGDRQIAGENTQKAIASGLREDIAAAEPAVAPINAELSKVINALEPTERSVLMHLKQNPGGISFLAHSKEALAALLLGRSPLFKSLIARMLNGPAAGSLSAIGGATPAAGIAVSQGAGLLGEPPQRNGIFGL